MPGPSEDYATLRAALNTPAPPPSNPPRWKKWRKGCAIGCGAYLALAVLMAIFNAIFGTPAADEAPAIAADTVATMSDSIVLGVPAPVPPDTMRPLPLAAPPPPPPPPPPVASEPAPPAKPTRKEATVYTTRTGEKYHRSGCSSLRKSRNTTTLSEAQAMGYGPCGRCRPPR